MLDTLLAIKKGMTSGYDARGRRVGATILTVEPNYVTHIKTEDGKDGYNAVQIGMGTKKSVKKPQLGHLKKASIEQKVRFMREVTVKDSSDLEPGKQLLVSQVFSKGDVVKVTGTSKGHGFQGGVKRYNFKGGPKTHGQSDRHRAPGSSGAGTTPGRVYKGHRGPGHYGVDTISYKNLEVLTVDKQNNLITIKGGVPGPIGGLIILQRLGVLKGYTPPPEEKPDEEEESGEGKVESQENQNTDTADNADTPVAKEETNNGN